MKRVLSILLIVLSIESVTSETVSAAKQVRKGHVTKQVRTGHTAVAKTGHTTVVRTGSNHLPRAHYYHGHYYPNCH
jgi:hypothetical protein